MFHSTMNDISERLGADFILIHRSTLLRSSFINHLRHEGRAWTAVLDDGSVERIAQTRIVALQAKLRSSSSDSEPASTNGEDSAESPAVPKRKVAAAFAHS
jgi:DNA-binding LytR/AlgR family response regulator